MGITQLNVSSKEMTPILSMGRSVLMLARAASRAISIFGPLMLPDLSSTSTTAVGFSGGGSGTHRQHFFERRLRLLRELRIAVAGDKNQASSRIDVFFEGCVFLGRKESWSG